MQNVDASYSFVLVAISLVVAAIGSFLAFNILRSAASGGARLSLKDLTLASIAQGGVGIWSMHFLGMLAVRLPVPHGYALIETLASLGISIGATAAAFAILTAKPHGFVPLLLSSLLLGLGVCAMHYLGMHGMRFDGYFLWSHSMVLTSLVLSVAGAALALWLVFSATSPKAQRAAPIVMAGAVSGMHYIAMGAAGFVCSVGIRLKPVAGHGVVESNDLTSVVITSLLAMVAVLALDQWLWAQPRMDEEGDAASGER